MLSPPLRERLTSLARREEVTLFMVLVASFSALLHRYSDQKDICIGVPVAGRELIETEPLIGLFVNALVIRTGSLRKPAFPRYSPLHKHAMFCWKRMPTRRLHLKK